MTDGERATRDLRILVAEDEKITQRIVKSILTNRGYQVTIAPDGLTAFEEIKMAISDGTPYHLLLTDHIMPGITGLELIDRLKKQQIAIPIIVFTHEGDKDLIIELMRYGCRDFLQKPIGPKIIDTIERVLRQSKTD